MSIFLGFDVGDCRLGPGAGLAQPVKIRQCQITRRLELVFCIAQALEFGNALGGRTIEPNRNDKVC